MKASRPLPKLGLAGLLCVALPAHLQVVGRADAPDGLAIRRDGEEHIRLGRDRTIVVPSQILHRRQLPDGEPVAPVALRCPGDALTFRLSERHLEPHRRRASVLSAPAMRMLGSVLAKHR